jgi:hypothetical protein
MKALILLSVTMEFFICNCYFIPIYTQLVYGLVWHVNGGVKPSVALPITLEGSLKLLGHFLCLALECWYSICSLADIAT